MEQYHSVVEKVKGIVLLCHSVYKKSIHNYKTPHTESYGNKELI